MVSLIIYLNVMFIKLFLIMYLILFIQFTQEIEIFRLFQALQLSISLHFLITSYIRAAIYCLVELLHGFIKQKELVNNGLLYGSEN